VFNSFDLLSEKSFLTTTVCQVRLDYYREPLREGSLVSSWNGLRKLIIPNTDVRLFKGAWNSV